MNQRDERRCERILASASLRKTEPRMAVLSALLRVSKPMSQEQISAKIGGGADKVTIYRTLESFINTGIVHKAYLQERIWHYELSDRCTEKQCHPHFTCSRCGQIFCMTDLLMPMAKSPHKGFKIEHQQVRLEGLCPECSESNAQRTA